MVLDFIFVAHFGMGIGGAAWATFIAQCIAVSGSLLYLKFELPQLKFRRDDCRMDWELLRKNASYSLVTGMQQMGLLSSLILYLSSEPLTAYILGKNSGGAYESAEKYLIR